MKNLSLKSQNWLFSCSGIGLLVRFLVFHPIKISFLKPEVCAIIFSTPSPVFKFTKKRNKKIKHVYVAPHATPFFVLLTKFLGFRRTVLWVKRKQGVNEQQRIQQFFFSLFHKFKCRWSSTKYYRICLRFYEIHFYVIKKQKPCEQPNPWTWKSRYWLFRNKFVIVEAVLNIVVQATAFARIIFST